MTAETVAAAARAELDIHSARDQDDRSQAARRARRQLDDAEQLFGTRLRAIPGTASQLTACPASSPARTTP